MEQEIQPIEDKNTSLTIRTKESLKDTFKSIEANTDNDKLIKLLELYEKFQATQDKFTIAANLHIIENAMNTIKSQINAISSATNQYERTLEEKYIVNISDEMKLLKEQIQNEEVLTNKITILEATIDKLNNNIVEMDNINNKLLDNIDTLEADNNKYIALNTELVNKENDYVNKLREQDKEINNKQKEINEIIANHKEDMEIIKTQCDTKISIIEEQYEISIKEYNDKLIEANKDNAILQTKIDGLAANNEEYKTTIDTMKNEHKADIDNIKQAHKAAKEVYETDINEYKLEIDKLKSKIELNAEELVKRDNREVKLNSRIETLTDNNNKLSDEIEAIKKEHQQEINQLKAKIEDLVNANNTIALDKAKLEAKLELLAANDKVNTTKKK